MNAEPTSLSEIRDARRRRLEATIAVDVDELNRLLSSDFTIVHALNAEVDSREAFIDSLRERRLIYKQITTEQDDVRIHGDMAVVTGIAHVVLDAGGGRDVPVDTRFTEVWARSGAGWQQVAFQGTRLPRPG
jgi:ketosteroid isomerase-like protein